MIILQFHWRFDVGLTRLVQWRPTVHASKCEIRMQFRNYIQRVLILYTQHFSATAIEVNQGG